MCGIAGILGEPTIDRLTAMADALRHRGPDDGGSWIGESDAAGTRIGLTYRRLAIIDIPGGAQPIKSENGRVVTVFNGEIYNYRELRDELIARGHRLTTQSDTEVIVHLYEDHGVDFLDRLRGMFALAVWDVAERRLILARDRLGKKPLYFRKTSRGFQFASEIKGLLADSREGCDLDHQSIADYLQFGAVFPPNTIYRGIGSLRPGEVVEARDRRVVSRFRYWRPSVAPKTRISRTDAVQRVDDLLREAVSIRLRSDVPVGCFLSGGVDSGLITAIAAQQLSKPLTTITVGFDDEAFDERPLARMVARQYGTDHHEVVVTPDVASDLSRIATAYDQPFGDSSAIPSFYVASAAREHVKVVLNGDGGDELFGGYRRYVAGRVAGWMGWTGGAMSQSLWRLALSALPKPSGYRSSYAFIHRFARGMAADAVTRHLLWTFDGLNPNALDGSHCRSSQRWFDDAEPAGRHIADIFANLGRCGGVDRMTATDLQTFLPHDLLVKMDIATMAHGLEARSPLLDQQLVDVVTRFPQHIKLRGAGTKPLLRQLAGRYLPWPIRSARKRGFEVPLFRWLREDLRDLSRDVILSPTGLPTTLFDRDELTRLLDNKQRLEPARWSRHVWLILMLGMWDREVHRTRGD